MKGGIIGYAAILAILISGAAAIIFTTQASPAEEAVTTEEGVLASSSNFNYLLLKTFSQSIEFISQRSAYDLGNYGGFVKGYEIPWNYYYPSIEGLEKNLVDKIKNTIPHSYKKINKTVTFDSIDIKIEPDNPSDSRSFYVKGEANISVYDDVARFRTFLNYKINSVVSSDYFRLLYTGREILENPLFNSSLSDVNNLKILLKNDPRFKDISFDIEASDGIVYINISKNCFDSYCISPLNAGEEEQNGFLFSVIPYDYNKLRFKIKAEQTTSIPSSFDFVIELDHTNDFVKSGQWKVIPLNMKATKTDDRIVSLTAVAVKKSTGMTEGSIAITFNPNNQMTDYASYMNISTSSFTPSGDYTITVTGDDGSGTIRTATLDLTVNPSMTFSITANPYTVKLIKESGYNNKTYLTVAMTSGVASNVNLYEIVGLPQGVSYAPFAPNNVPPNFVSTLTLTTDGTTQKGDYTIKVRGKGGGSYAETEFILHLEELFDFDFSFTGREKDTIFRTKDTSTSLEIKTTHGKPENVDFSFTIVNTLTGLTDPSGNNYYIKPLIAPTPCVLTEIIPNCFRTMSISTTKDTPAGIYDILVNASATKVWHQKIFELTVKWGCGDGIIVSPEQCEGANLNGKTCASQGYPRGGTLACIPPGQSGECMFDTSNCIYCGNNKVEVPEECDRNNAIQCPGNCNVTDCTCPTVFSGWSCSSFSGGTNVFSKSNYFSSPNCNAGWYPVSCSSENAFPRYSNDQGKYGEDEIQKIIFDGNHCSVMAKDDNGNNEQLRNACVLCINKQPTVLWGVTSFYNGDHLGKPIGGGIVNGWYELQFGLPSKDFSFVVIDSQPCVGKYPISCLVDANESDQGWRNLLDDVYLDNSGICHATFRNNPEDNEKAFTINIGIVCVDKNFYQGGSKIQWSGYSQGFNIQGDVNGFPTPSCSGSDIPVSVFARNDHRLDSSNPGNYLDDVMQSTFISGQRFNVTARDTWAPGNEQNRTVGILCAPSVS